MPRRPRWFEPALPLHIVQRGNNRMPCFASPEDHRSYLHWLHEYALQHRCPLHAYVMMTNHVHLLLTPTDVEGPSALMQDLGRSYVRRFNRKYERSGTLWEGRFKAHPVERRQVYQAFFGEPEDPTINDAIRACVATGHPYGSPAFRKRVASSLGLRLDVPRGRPRRIQDHEPENLLLDLG